MTDTSLQQTAEKAAVESTDRSSTDQAAVGSFLSEVTSHLDMAVPADEALGANQPFQGPNGLICSIDAVVEDGDVRARPQLLLPLGRDEIGKLKVDALLSVQSTLLKQLGWTLGESKEGLLELSPVDWTAQARDVARELDLGSAVGSMVLAMLRPASEDGAPEFTQGALSANNSKE